MNWCAVSVIDNGLANLSTSVTNIKLVSSFSINADTFEPVIGTVLADRTISASATLSWYTPPYGYLQRRATWTAGGALALQAIDSDNCVFVAYNGATPLFAVDAYPIAVDMGDEIYFVPLEYRIKRDKWLSQAVCENGLLYLNDNADKVKLVSSFSVNNETDAITVGTVLCEVALDTGQFGFNAKDSYNKRDRYLKFPPILTAASAAGGGSGNHVIITDASNNVLLACNSGNLQVEQVGDQVYFVGLKILSDQLD